MPHFIYQIAKMGHIIETLEGEVPPDPGGGDGEHRGQR